MKTFAIAVSLAFLGACHSVHGIDKIDKALPDVLCSSVRDLEVCPLTPLRCAYETIRAVSHDYDNTIKLPCAVPSELAKCEQSDNDEEGCLKKGCIWIHRVWTAQHNQTYNICSSKDFCTEINDQSLCEEHPKHCKWDTSAGYCWDLEDFNQFYKQRGG